MTWNELPLHLRSIDNVTCFKKNLKNYYYDKMSSYQKAPVLLVWFALPFSLLKSQYTPVLYLYRRQTMFMAQGGGNLIFTRAVYKCIVSFHFNLLKN